MSDVLRVWECGACCDCDLLSHHGEIHRSIATCAGAGGLLISPSSDTCFLILHSAVSCRVPISGHLAEEPTSSKWPRNLGGKPQPRRQSLAKSWLKLKTSEAEETRVPWTFCNAGKVTRRPGHSRSQAPVGAGAGSGKCEERRESWDNQIRSCCCGETHGARIKPSSALHWKESIKNATKKNVQLASQQLTAMIWVFSYTCIFLDL